jgi:hypothetical protein
MPCKSAGRQSWPGRQRGPNQASQAEASTPSQPHCWQPMYALAFRKFGARATVKLPLPQYSSSRSPPVLPAARRGKRRAAKRSQVYQSVQMHTGRVCMTAMAAAGGHRPRAERRQALPTCCAPSPAEHVLAHAAVWLAEGRLHLHLPHLLPVNSQHLLHLISIQAQLLAPAKQCSAAPVVDTQFIKASEAQSTSSAPVGSHRYAHTPRRPNINSKQPARLPAATPTAHPPAASNDVRFCRASGCLCQRFPQGLCLLQDARASKQQDRREAVQRGCERQQGGGGGQPWH